jgi:hypothetical protein
MALAIIDGIQASGLITLMSLLSQTLTIVTTGMVVGVETTDMVTMAVAVIMDTITTTIIMDTTLAGVEIEIKLLKRE